MIVYSYKQIELWKNKNKLKGILDKVELSWYYINMVFDSWSNAQLNLNYLSLWKMWVSYGFLDRTLGGFKRGSPQNLFQGQGLINPRGYSIKLWVVTTWWLSSNKPHKVAPYGTMEKAGLRWPWCHLSGSIPLFSSKVIKGFYTLSLYSEMQGIVAIT